MTFVLFTILLIGLSGWLDSRLNWPAAVTRGRRERL
jgi:hypothetical protein